MAIRILSFGYRDGHDYVHWTEGTRGERITELHLVLAHCEKGEPVNP
jgi:hypothetical protein